MPSVVMLLVAGLSVAEMSPTGIGQELRAIPFPDLTQLDELVQEQLRDGKKDLENVLEQKDASVGKRAHQYGELGNLYHEAYSYIMWRPI